MDSRTVALVRESFAQVANRATELADRFYTNLFTRQASVRAFFPADVTEQKGKLPTTIQTLINNAETLENLEPTLGELGKRYAAQGVLRTHYAAVARTFIDAVRETSGTQWQARYGRAWDSLFDAVIKRLVKAATAKETPASANPATAPFPAARPETTKKPTGGKAKRAA